jgi:hypothetical protein
VNQGAQQMLEVGADRLADRIADRQLVRLDELAFALGYPEYDADQREVVRVALRLAARDVLEGR